MKRVASTSWAIVTLAIGLCWVLPAPYFNNLNNPNENVRVYMTRSIVEHGTFAIDDVIAEWGYVNDKATFDGRMYPGKAPGVSMLAAIPYAPYHWANEALGRSPTKHEVVQVCRIGTSVVPLLVFLVAFAGYTRRITTDETLRQLGVVALGCGSTVLVYGMIFASHALLAACLFGAWMASAAHRDNPDRWLPAWGVGVLVGGAVAVEYPGFIGAAIIGLHAIARSPSRVRFMAWSAFGAALPIGLVMFFHHAAFGGVFETAYSHLENPEFVEHVSGGFFGMERIQPEALWGSFFAPSNGLFWFMPWTVLAVAALPWMAGREGTRDEAIVTLLVLAGYTLFISMVHNWRGGWTAGPRYIVGLVPFLASALVHALEAAGASRWRGPVLVVTTALVGLGAFACGISAAVFPHYPTELLNPIYELALPLLDAGYAPWSVVTAGLMSPTQAIVLVGVALGTATLTPLLADRELDGVERSVAATVALSLVLAGATAAAIPATGDATVVHRNRAFVQLVWEPLETDTLQTLRRARLPSFATRGDTHAAALRALGRDAARMGYAESAAALYRAANDAANRR